MVWNDSSGSGQGLVAACCEHGKQMSNYYILRKDSAPWSSLDPNKIIFLSLKYTLHHIHENSA
jgi:hypothetical protein